MVNSAKLPALKVKESKPITATSHGNVKKENTKLFNQKDESDEPSTAAITIRQGKQKVFTLFNQEIDLNRWQGEIGIFIPDAGYPFGDIPEWLIKQRAAIPSWAKKHELSIKKI